MNLTEFLFQRHGQAHAISLLSMTESLWIFFKDIQNWSEDVATEVLVYDYSVRGKRDVPSFLKNKISLDAVPALTTSAHITPSVTPKRQLRHLQQ